MDSNDRTALVTGANRGIGFETAKELAEKGLRVVLTARNEAKGADAAARIAKETGGSVSFQRLDIADDSSIAALKEQLRSGGTRIDILINNAATTMDGFDEAVARGTIDTNFYGPILLTDALLPLIADGGAIVMVTSSAGQLSIVSGKLKDRFLDSSLTREGLFDLVESFVDSVRRGRHSEEGWPTSAYGVSKLALNAYVRITAPLLSSRGIRLNAVDPGWVRSDMGGAGAPRTLQQGAGSVLWAALLEDDRSGGFHRDGRSLPW